MRQDITLLSVAEEVLAGLGPLHVDAAGHRARRRTIVERMDTMIAAARGSTLIFTILIQRRSPEKFRKHWERQLQQLYPDDAMRERYRQEFSESYSPLHCYNDIAGFVELYWDGGTRILANYFFRGDRSRKFGKQLARSCWTPGARISPNQFYWYARSVETGGIPHSECGVDLKREAILEALQEVHNRITDLGCYVDLTHEQELLRAIDVSVLFTDANSA